MSTCAVRVYPELHAPAVIAGQSVFTHLGKLLHLDDGIASRSPLDHPHPVAQRCLRHCVNTHHRVPICCRLWQLQAFFGVATKQPVVSAHTLGFAFCGRLILLFWGVFEQYVITTHCGGRGVLRCCALRASRFAARLCGYTGFLPLHRAPLRRRYDRSEVVLRRQQTQRAQFGLVPN
eukprot:COSAG02_NODE_2872_length_7854_cov_57.759381_6_plen_177_part_00